MVAILSIQSNVATGHVGNAAALLPLQMLGHEVWPVDTVVFSNHPAHGSHTGRIVEAQEIAALLDGIKKRGLFSVCDAVLTGYLGTAAAGRAAFGAARTIKQKNKRALFLCDPVLGDNGRLYVEEDILDFYRTNIGPLTDIVTPNAYEAELLTGIAVCNREDALEALARLKKRGVGTVLITGLVTGFGSDNTLETYMATNDGVWAAACPLYSVATHGAGDLFSALFLGFLVRGDNAVDALSHALSAVADTLAIAQKSNAADLPVVAARLFFADPKTGIELEKIK